MKLTPGHLFLITAMLAAVGCPGGGSKPTDGGETFPDGGAKLPDGGSPPPNDGGVPTDGGVADACHDYNPGTKNLYWGDVHVHTSFSHDAFANSTPSGPAQAYAFAQGTKINLSPVGGKARTSTIARPLDFVAVTDHAEMLGKSTYGGGTASTSWSRSSAATEAAYDASPSCKFTSLHGFEWSGAVSGNWYHRNVFFRTAAVPQVPLSADTYPTPQQLWTALDTQCTEAMGCRVLTVPHNGNWSQNGILYSVPDSVTVAAAKQRAKYEHVTEVYQHKGASECELGVGGTTDGECGWEQQYPVDCNATPNNSYCTYGSYARNAILRGIQLEQEMGVNPLQLGFIASTDTHNATPGQVDEYLYQGQAGDPDSTPALRTAPAGDRFRSSGGGIVAVWAPQNRREDIFDAIYNREAYASSGPRIPLRFFGGWGLPSDLCTQADLAAQGYQKGVPMGQTLPAPASGVTAPSFALLAQKDSGPAGHPGVDLQYAQVVKVWYDPSNGSTHQNVYDVVGDKTNGASVDTSTCKPSGAGVTTLCKVWTDPDFQKTQAAAYYVRVFQNPTCTSRAYDCNSFNAANRPAICDDASSRLSAKERVWSSPIWYTP